jgi:hypothetical protein
VIAGQLETIRATAIADGISEVFLIGAGLTVIAFAAAFFLREIPLRKTHGASVMTKAASGPASDVSPP